MVDRLTSAQLEARFRRDSGHDAMPSGWIPVGAWVRVSPGKGQDEANQVPAVITHCISNKYWPAKWYVVHAKSAFHGEQQDALNQAIEDMREGITRILVIWHSDRLERRHEQGKQPKTLISTLAEFKDAGGRVESQQEPQLGQLDMGGQVSTFITGIMNHEKSKHISEQVNLALDRIKANKALYNGNVPWGWTVSGEKYEKGMIPTDICREYVPQIFQRCIDGQSLRQIAAWLDSENVPTSRGGKWNEGSVRWIITTRAYAGRHVSRDTGETICTCEEIIKPSVFERANKALKSHGKRGPTNLDNRPMLAKLHCLRCDSPMYRIKAGKKQRYYYRCYGSGPQRKGCGNMVPMSATDTAVAFVSFVSNTKPYRTREWVEGKNYDDQISNVKQDLREAVEAERFADLAALQAQLEEYRLLNETAEPGHYANTYTRKSDGSTLTQDEYDALDSEGRKDILTIHEHFIELDNLGQRDMLTQYDIRVEKVVTADAGNAVRVIVDEEDFGAIAINP